MKPIYIAAPFGAATHDERLHNTMRAVTIANVAAAIGYEPVVVAVAAMTSPTEVGDPTQGLVNCPRCGDPLLCIRVSGGWLRVCEACRPPGPRRTNPALDPKPVAPRDVCVATVDRCG